MRLESIEKGELPLIPTTDFSNKSRKLFIANYEHADISMRLIEGNKYLARFVRIDTKKTDIISIRETSLQLIVVLDGHVEVSTHGIESNEILLYRTYSLFYAHTVHLYIRQGHVYKFFLLYLPERILYDFSYNELVISFINTIVDKGVSQIANFPQIATVGMYRVMAELKHDPTASVDEKIVELLQELFTSISINTRTGRIIVDVERAGLMEEFHEYFWKNRKSKLHHLEADIKSRFKLSSHEVSEIFLNLYGFDVARYLSDEKIIFSLDLLLKTDHTIKAIAETAGYSSADSFIRSFANVFKNTPGEYRKRD